MALVLRTPSHRFWRYHGKPQAWFEARTDGRGPAGNQWKPEVTVRKKDGRLVYAVDVDGANPEDLDVSISKDAITIRRELRQERRIERRGYEWREISRSSFSHSLDLPRSVVWENAEATYEDGVLQVSMDIVEEVPKRIEIRTGE
ncbi:MAG: Hsp20/alpha crystallin family protein [Actinobacteria bacterium]|nr:Hsp20/alpha crystallin family protein [Actinomycetota bacterium]